MARSLSSMFLRNMTNFSATRMSAQRCGRSLFRSSSDVRIIPDCSSVHLYKVSGLSYQNAMKYSTTSPNDPDTHEDFRPTSKVESSLSVKDIVDQDVKENPVMIYMKGNPEMPRCGFSSLAVRVLKEYRVPIGSRNILEDLELKDAVKSYSHWPTFPQIFIKGEFIGGSDIILNMHQTGELEQKLKEIVPSEKKAE